MRSERRVGEGTGLRITSHDSLTERDFLQRGCTSSGAYSEVERAIRVECLVISLSSKFMKVYTSEASARLIK